MSDGACKTHPCAPHGYDRGSSHALDRCVCECERWEPESECSAVQLMAEIDAMKARHRADLEALRDAILIKIHSRRLPRSGWLWYLLSAKAEVLMDVTEDIRTFDLDEFQTQREDN